MKALRQVLKKMAFGVIMTFFVTTSWVGATHCLKATYTGLFNTSSSALLEALVQSGGDSVNGNKNTTLSYSSDFSAPFCTTWFCSLGSVFFLPIYFLGRILTGSKNSSLASTLRDSVQNFRDKGFTPAKFLGRCCFFAALWTLTNYLYVFSLKILGGTEVMALFATNVSFIYLLSWVVLHEQFVGIRIVAVILSNTGIALLAYMDGIDQQSPTLGGVVLAAASAAGSSVYKVLFKRVVGEVSFCQVIETRKLRKSFF